MPLCAFVSVIGWCAHYCVCASTCVIMLRHVDLHRFACVRQCHVLVIIRCVRIRLRVYVCVLVCCVMLCSDTSVSVACYVSVVVYCLVVRCVLHRRVWLLICVVR